MEVRGREASCKALVLLFGQFKARGLDTGALAQGVSCPAERLTDKSRRVSWDDFRTVMANAGRLCSAAELAEIGCAALSDPVFRYLAAVARLLYSTRDLYFWGMGAHRSLIHQDYAVFRTSLVELGPDRLLVEVTMREPYEPSPEFFAMAQGMLSVYPSVYKLPRAAVTLEPISGGARYSVRYTQGGGVFSRLRRFLMTPIVIRDTASELRHAHDLLQQRYLDLEREVEARQQAETKHRRLVTALESAGEAVVVTDVEGIIQYVNPQFEEQTGFASGEVVGRTPALLSSGLQDAAFYRAMREALSQDGIWRGVLVNRRKDGTFYDVEETIAPVRHADGSILGYVAVERDITERKRAEQTIAEQQRKMLASERLTTLGVMAGNIAHEIRNPVAVVSVAGEQIEERIARLGLKDTALVAAAAMVRRNSERIEQIIRGLQRIARDGAADPFREAPVRQIVADTLELCAARFRARGIRLHVPDIAADFNIECQPTQISQVLLNLLDNACDAIEPLEEKWVRVDVVASDTWVEMAVTDSGAGLPPAVRHRVMEPFFTTKDDDKGTGMGLSISATIAERHNGTLDIDDACPNTRFVLRVPRRLSERPAEAQSAPSMVSPIEGL